VDRHKTSLAFEKVLGTAPHRPAENSNRENSPSLNISVIFTTVRATLAALRKAGNLANGLGARITLLVPQVVPFPAPLDSSLVLPDWNERRFRLLATGCPVEIRVRIYLCRDRLETMDSVLEPGSIVVLGSRNRPWPTSEDRLARALRRSGHLVILTGTE
jgi:hypothetical protein